MRTTIGIESLRRYLKCTSIALQHAYQHTVCSRADVGRRRVNPNADRVSRVAHAPLRFGRLGSIAAAPPTRHAAPNSMPFDDLAARREPDRFSATMRGSTRSAADLAARTEQARPRASCTGATLSNAAAAGRRRALRTAAAARAGDAFGLLCERVARNRLRCTHGMVVSHTKSPGVRSNFRA